MSDFWRGKSVLVTGGAGFLGSHLVERLVAEGAKVTVPVRSCESDVSFLAAVKDRVRIVTEDLMDLDACVRAAEGQEVVMNLAAEIGGLEYNIKYPALLFRNNLQIFMNVIEAARIQEVERFLVTSSACVYPRYCTIPTPESEGTQGRPEPTNEGYGWAKRMQEFLATSYASQYGMTVAIARLYNLYGPRDNFDPGSSHVIPALIKRILDGEDPLKVWGDGTQSRAFLYTEDAARGLMEVAEKYAEADPLNVGPDEEISVKELVELLIELTGAPIRYEFDVSKPAGQPRRKCDIRKAAEKIGYRAQVPLRDGLRTTIEWYRTMVTS